MNTLEDPAPEAPERSQQNDPDPVIPDHDRDPEFDQFWQTRKELRLDQEDEDRWMLSLLRQYQN